MGLWELVTSLRRDLAGFVLNGGGAIPFGWSWGGLAAWVGPGWGWPLGTVMGRVLEAQTWGGTAEVRLVQGSWNLANLHFRDVENVGKRLGRWAEAVGMSDTSYALPDSLGSITLENGDDLICGGLGSLRLWCLGERAAVGVRREGVADLGWLCGLVGGNLGDEGRGIVTRAAPHVTFWLEFAAGRRVRGGFASARLADPWRFVLRGVMCSTPPTRR